MRKGFIASVAALAAGAGMALGQGAPPQPPMPPPNYPAWSGPGGPPPAGPMPGDPNAFLGGPPGYPAGPNGYPGGPTDVPPAGEMPLYGQVAGPDAAHPVNPGAQPKYGTVVGQLHKAAGGPDRWWVDVEENVWVVRSMPFAFPILTAGNVGATGSLGEPGTRILLGDKNLDYGEFNVFRLNLGLWDSCRVWGVELSGFISEQRTQPFDASQSASGMLINNFVIARPFIDATTGLNSSLIIASPGNFGGTVSVADRLHMGGAEANILRNLMYCDKVKLSLVGGLRFIDVDEQLDVVSISTLPNSADPNNPIINNIADHFHVENQFFGGQLGLETELRAGRFFVDLTGKVGLGNMHEVLNIAGSTTQTIGTSTNTLEGGLLALATNIGHYTRNEFAYAPEGTIKFGFQWTQRISTYIGVNGLYLSRVLRPGEQIDPVVNTTLVPVSTQFGNVFGPLRPQAPIKQSDMAIGGGTIGLSIRY
jgi:hypothetical protein